MEILFFCPRWGSEHLSWEEFCSLAKTAGYTGVEAGVPFNEVEKAEMKMALKKNKLLLIGQYWQSFERDFETHKTSFKNYLENIASLHPLKIDSQTGKDYFNFNENRILFEIAQQFTTDTNIPVLHETHRNKALFAAHITQQFLNEIPSLKITADFSHWCTVSESYLQDQQQAVQLAIARTGHIHARVGHTQGPQVTDPRLPEWKEALEHHINWWKKIASQHQKNNAESLTITPEFGPVPYLLQHPVTKQPLANQWEINLWMMEFLDENLT